LHVAGKMLQPPRVRPLLPPGLPAFQNCAFDPRCYPEMFCCVDQTDCREKPQGYCGSLPCDRLTGTCGGACLASCDWGYECGRETGYVCRAKAVMTCPLAGMNCEQEPCMECNGETLAKRGSAWPPRSAES